MFYPSYTLSFSNIGRKNSHIMSGKDKLYVNGQEKIKDFPPKYNRLVKLVKGLTYSVIILNLAVIILVLKYIGVNILILYFFLPILTGVILIFIQKWTKHLDI